MMKKLTIAFVTLLLTLYNNCGTETEITQDVIRGAVTLSTDKIPALAGSIQAPYGKPWLWSGVGINNNYNAVIFVNGWGYTLSDSGHVSIRMVIVESKEIALRYLIKRRESSTLPLELQQPEDLPAIAGDISFGLSGNLRDGECAYFIRDNIVFEIYVSGIIASKIVTIAQQIDKIVIESPTYSSFLQVKPIINNIKISTNPVLEDTNTSIVLEAEDPNSKELYFDWWLDPNVGYGGLVSNDDNNWVYAIHLPYQKPENGDVEVNICVFNDLGFVTDSTILIRSIKK